MNMLPIESTLPVLTDAGTLQFSAYGFGWGYRSFSLLRETVRTCLGARDTSEQQIRLAFELNRHRILRAVGPFSAIPYQGETIPVPVENL
ncbi:MULTISPECIES: hypothetical protein [Burkholderia]|uniref:Uncharacterized protein n=2 Tax=Burkholderia TaxID=32008 RepID=A0A071MEC6_9BURK|nr:MULTISPECIES: hypothetical protein [Burkholderia]AKM03691.1 hypothetical protein ABD05_26755 [Burkholderia pyrrocinia]GAU03989.1 hypothetical protein BSLA_02r1304 [Burkholderia stabilis]AOJ28880.1 hypothetical protein WJ12_29075 [Burkholderia seminalis]KVF52991.1 hypothetical protein WJ13_07570 [Burkholderia seminalis]MBJ9595231.1 hypothetical protein [Burkholderia seminalis]